MSKQKLNMENNIRITRLDELKAWNKNPTTEKPILLEWFMDWFFNELIDKDKIEEAIEARNEMIEFTVICEKITREDAIKRVDSNFDYYSNYATTRWVDKLKIMMEYEEKNA